MKPVLKVEYLVTEDSMAEEEYNNQEFRKFTITEEMILQIVMQNDPSISPDQCICKENFFIKKL